jgi:hypothetical protein
VIWAILAALGVPLWLCAIGILMLVLQNRKLRKRPGNIPVRILRPGKKRWRSAHAIWVSDVFAYRGSPAAWDEDLVQVSGVSVRAADTEEREKLHRIGRDPVVASFALVGGGTLEVASQAEDRAILVGPLSNATAGSLSVHG